MIFLWKSVFFGSILFLSIMSMNQSFATTKGNILSPLKQLENGEVPFSVICTNGLVLMQNIHRYADVACVRLDTVEKLGNRGWLELGYTAFTPITKDNMIEIVIVLKTPPIIKDVVFIKKIGGNITSNWAGNNEMAIMIPKDKLWTLENYQRVINIMADSHAREQDVLTPIK